MDFFIDNAMKQVIRELCDKDYVPSIPDWKLWKHLTERMLRWMPAEKVIEKVYEVIEGVSDEDWSNGYPPELFQVLEKQIPKEKVKIDKAKKSQKTIQINENLPIIEVAKKYGLKIKNNSAICPFHPDTDPSLKFYPETNSFFCFGACHKGGDVIEFIRKMEEKKVGN